ncbi:hypothetical protein Clacol_004880 [Clathrus columnatus]|uniref:IucC family-domain-containing protein n=1 Tax=Clathrus columnatus TaxID=1419009 RepID=A0AAV5AB01_9AGAM|nr:hypothetical protein Clacol_004880 [Clathrus columnatus]
MLVRSASCLKPFQRASFATAARLLSCVVTESLLRAIFIPICSNDLKGIAVILNSDTSQTGPVRAQDVFAVIPLRDIPFLKPDNHAEIGLLDPLDMLPYVYEPKPLDSAGSPVSNGYPKEIYKLKATIQTAVYEFGLSDLELTPSPGPLHLWSKFAEHRRLGKSLEMDVAEELRNSMEWQQYAYENLPPMPTFESPSILWEQCIIEGHPTHPMHKMRRTLPPINEIAPGEFNWQEPHVRMVVVPRHRLNIQGPWDDYITPFIKKVRNIGENPLAILPTEVLVPVHELQIMNILEKFPEARVLPEEYSFVAFAQQSLRSVIIPAVMQATHLKLAFGIRLTSAVRTISPASAFLGPRFSSQVVPNLIYDRSLMIVQRELASVSSVHPDGEIAKHLACIVRECYENTCEEEHNERAIVCTALVETGYGGSDETPLVQIVFGLDDQEKRVAWLDRFVDLFFKAFLPSVIANGVAFEAHPQNTLARFDIRSKELTGFVVRDFGGLRVHERSVIESTPLESLEGVIAPGHSIIADTLEDVYTRLYHTLIHNHLQQLIRVLKLHYNGIGWEIVRSHLEKQIPGGHELGKLWLAPETETLPGKCFMRMRFQGMYRTHLHAPFLNLIHYKGSKDMN